MSHVSTHRQDLFGGIRSWILHLSFVVALTVMGFGVSLAADTQQSEAEVLVAQGVVAYDEHRYYYALDVLSRARDLSPRDSRGLYYLGLTLLALKNPSEAVSALQAAKDIQPSDSAINYQLGIAYFTAGQIGRAHV